MQSKQQYSHAAIQDAVAVHWAAEQLAGMHWPQCGRVGRLSVPPQWTAWLLTEKAGVPRDLIAYVSHAAPARVGRRLTIATALMLFAPYAGRIERLMEEMPRYGAARVLPLQPAKIAGRTRRLLSQ